MSDWDANAYSLLNRPHSVWAQTVLNQLSFHGSELVLDAGCGAGNLTRNIAPLVPSGHIIALDKSRAMIAEAAIQTSIWKSRITLLRADLLYVPIHECIDLIFSNATFHWIHDHKRLFSEMFRILRPGGKISAQFGGGPNIKLLLHYYTQLSHEPQFEYLAEEKLPWNFSSVAEIKAHAVNAGFTNINASLTESPEVFRDIPDFSHFVEKIILFPLLDNIHNKQDRHDFVTQLAIRTLTGEMPLTVDYWRINFVAQKPKNTSSPP